MIRKCSKCEDYRAPAAEFQDEKYGKGNRVFNKRKGDTGHRCTVCGNETKDATKAPDKPNK